VPGGDAAAFVAARFRGADARPGTDGAAGAAWPCVGSAVMQVPARTVAPYLAPDSVLEDRGDGTCRLTAGSWSWTALAALFAGFDADFVVDGPAELRDATTGLAARLSAAAAGQRPGP
jgi:hypothetical protein